jgi:hypothetical protein
MQKPSHRTATLIAGALGALALALPARGYAYSARYSDYDDYSNRPYYQEPYYGQGQRSRDWQHLQHERQEMEEARREGDWDRYRHEKREAKEAARTLRHHHHHDSDD